MGITSVKNLVVSEKTSGQWVCMRWPGTQLSCSGKNLLGLNAWPESWRWGVEEEGPDSMFLAWESLCGSRGPKRAGGIKEPRMWSGQNPVRVWPGDRGDLRPEGRAAQDGLWGRQEGWGYGRSQKDCTETCAIIFPFTEGQSWLKCGDQFGRSKPQRPREHLGGYCNKITWKWCSSEVPSPHCPPRASCQGEGWHTAGFQKNSSLVNCSGAVSDSVKLSVTVSCHVKSPTSCKCFLLIKA